MRAGWVALLCALGMPTVVHAETRFALLVGHNLGHANEVALRWAEEDARRMRRLLVDIGNVDADRAVLLRGPSRTDVAEAITRLQGAVAEAERRGEHTVVLFYYSGHADDAALHLALEAVPVAELDGALRGLGADTVVAIVDACRNDRTPRSQSKGAARAPAFDWPAAAPDGPKGYVRLSSASRGEVAQESDDLQGSLFSHHLLSGLRGSADFDGDGVVTLGEVYRYGYRRTLEDSHRQAAAVQHSELKVDLSGRGELIMTYPRRAQARLTFGDDIGGHLLIIDDASDRIVAELHAPGGAERRLAVATGRYRIQLRQGQTFRTGLVRAGGGEQRVSLADLKRQDALAVLAKGANFDPNRWALIVGGGMGRSAVEGFDPVPFGVAGFEWRWSPRFQIVVRGYLGHQTSNGSPWQLEQYEWGAAAGVDWSFLRSAHWDVRLGLRAGVVGALQFGERTDADRLLEVGLVSVERDVSNAGWGPDFAAPFTLEFYPWTRLGVRVTASPSIRWLQVADDTTARWGISVEGAGVIRL